jgi:hypothetical protein
VKADNDSDGKVLTRRIAAIHWLIGAVALASIIAIALLWVRQGNTKLMPEAKVTSERPIARSGQAGLIGSPPETRRSNTDPRSHMSRMPALPSRERIAEQLFEYEANFRKDKLDPGWAPSAEKSLVEAATEPALTEYGVPEDFEARCLSRMCKITMTFQTQGQATDWAELYVLGMAGAVTAVRTQVGVSADGRPQLLIYGARKGFETLLK